VIFSKKIHFTAVLS